MRIYFDMDGTIANLYADPNWLPKLRAFDIEPYEKAEPMVAEETLLALIEQGYELAIISWLAGYHNNKEYDKAVRQAKKDWLARVYPNVKFAEKHFVKFGTPKYRVANENGILVDDELNNRLAWKGIAIAPNEIENLLQYDRQEWRFLRSRGQFGRAPTAMMRGFLPQLIHSEKCF